MKHLLIAIALMLGSLPATAQWKSGTDQRLTVDGNFLAYDAQTSKDGVTFVLFWKLIRETPESLGNRYSDNVDYAYYLQIVDNQGEKLLPDEGRLLSHEATRSFSMGAEPGVFTDSDGNALLIVKDQRNWNNPSYPNQSYFIYKISPEGQLLWERPLDLDRGTAYFLASNIKLTEMSDGSYLIVHEISEIEYHPYLAIDKVSKDGDFIWEDPLLLIDRDDKLRYSYPFLVDAGGGDFIVAYSKGGAYRQSADAMYAQKFSSQKEALWKTETPVYTKGFTSGHYPWTVFSVTSDAKGGFFAGWFDDHLNSKVEKTYVSHILSNGEQGFVTSGDDEGLRLNWNEGMRGFRPTLCYDPATEALYVAYEEHNSNQSYRSTVLQKVSGVGELHWSNPSQEAGNINGFVLNVSGSHSLQLAGEGKIAFFYPGNAYAVGLFDVSGEQPHYVWPSERFVFSQVSAKSNLLVTPLIDNEYFLTFWLDYRTGSSTGEVIDAVFGQKVVLPGPIVSDPASLDFGEVLPGETKTGDKIMVSLRNHLSLLTASSFSLASGTEGIFKIVSVVPKTPAEPQVAEVVLSFTPSAAQIYTDTLIVRTNYAEVRRIPLSGIGINPTGIGDVVETGRAPSLHVKNSDIVVTHAAAGSRIEVYNLQGQLLKTQTVAADTEILETASFPRGVYIVAVNDRQEILKRKIVL
ncbi:MAG: T9SS type A sorting domain-containing protein [Dysgonamonadaceae bacterium]|jgi:hypothetical protein|nr:T9SS type A sorting domain-containing protein [Dysgonamonadaceae bacterium]